MKNYTIEFENITSKSYVPIIKRKVSVIANDLLTAKSVFNNEFKNKSGKKYKILNVNEAVVEV